MKGGDLRAAFDRFAAHPAARNGYDANVEVDPEIFFPRNANKRSDGKYFWDPHKNSCLTKFMIACKKHNLTEISIRSSVRKDRGRLELRSYKISLSLPCRSVLASDSFANGARSSTKYHRSTVRRTFTMTWGCARFSVSSASS